MTKRTGTIKKNKCVHDDYEVMMDIFAKELTRMNSAIWKRCSLEGCRYGYELIDKELLDNCMYCGEPRNYYFDTFGPVKSIAKTLKKRRPKLL